MSNAGSSELYGGLQETSNMTLFGPSFWYSFAISYVCSATGVIIAFMCFCVPWAQLKKRKRRFISYMSRGKIHAMDTNQLPKLFSLSLLEKGNQEVSRVLDELTSTKSFMELCEVTDYFNITNVIGAGKTGMVYKAKLSNGSQVAVKRLNNSKLLETKFALEIMILLRLKHKNLVDLLGFCTERKQRILVYEFVPNGKLSDWLHPLQNEAFPLEWPIRLKIALGLARGLSGLHHSCNWQICHLGISSEHVLLHQNFEPKIWNFRKAKLGKGFDEQISYLVKVAIDCIQMSLHQRPSMLDVYKNIKRLWEGYETDD